MIPPFNEHGYLPPGLHPASMDEIADRFGQATEVRRVQLESLRWLVDTARVAGVLRLVVNGSFVTDEPEPNDVDCALLIGPGFPKDASAEQEILTGLPFLHVELVEDAEFRSYVEVVFGTDRHLTRKGLIEVIS